MTRTAARQLAMQLSFAVNAGSDMGPDGFFDEEYFRALPAEDGPFAEIPDEAQLRYIRALVSGVAAQRAQLDEIISKYAQGWKPERISRTAMAVLRCALYEILYLPEVPPSVAINEAVEMAKSYDQPETVSFINGILGSFMRDREVQP